jgi:hypothetical protein
VRKNVIYKVNAIIDSDHPRKNQVRVEQGLISDKGKNKESKNKKGEITSTKIFADYIGSENDNDDIQIYLPSDGGIFKSGEKSKVGSRNTFDITYVLKGSPGGSKGRIEDKQQEERTDSSFMNKYAISPVPRSNIVGTEYTREVFTFEWRERFPISGEYTFRGLCDNKAQLYLDNLKIADLDGFNSPIRPIKKTITRGFHNIRIELQNEPDFRTLRVNTNEITTK